MKIEDLDKAVVASRSLNIIKNGIEDLKCMKGGDTEVMIAGRKVSVSRGFMIDFMIAERDRFESTLRVMGVKL